MSKVSLGTRMMIKNNTRRGYSPTGAGLSGEERRKKTMQGAVALRKFAKDMAGQSGIAGIDRALGQRKAVVAKANERNSKDFMPSNAGEFTNKNYRRKAKRALDVAKKYTASLDKRR
jgi:hypothetical protein